MKLPPHLEEDFSGLPGESLVRSGLIDLAEGRKSIGSLLVQIGSPRLRLLDIPLPEEIDLDADRKLYSMLGKDFGNEAHSKYNSLLRS